MEDGEAEDAKLHVRSPETVGESERSKGAREKRGRQMNRKGATLRGTERETNSDPDWSSAGRAFGGPSGRPFPRREKHGHDL